MTSATDLSGTQIAALRRAAAVDNCIHRFVGGFWVSGNNWKFRSDGWVSIQTIRALEKRGLVERTHSFPEEWRDPRRLTRAGMLVVASAAVQAGTPLPNESLPPVL